MSDPAGQLLSSSDFEVRWGELDAFNHVNNAHYLRWLEEARLQWFARRCPGWVDDRVGPVVASIQLDYRRPVGWPQTVRVLLDCRRVGNSSLELGHRIVDAADSGQVHAEGRMVLVWVDRASGSSTPLPAGVRAACAAPPVD